MLFSVKCAFAASFTLPTIKKKWQHCSCLQCYGFLVLLVLKVNFPLKFPDIICLVLVASLLMKLHPPLWPR